jgi:hypothetical protein
MASLTGFKFTKGADLAVDADGWFLGKNERAKALAGNDTIIGSRDFGEGIENTGSIQGDAGDDRIIGKIFLATIGNGIYNGLGGAIKGGDGNDIIRGQSPATGINNDLGSTINGDRGDDAIIGSGSTGILNSKACLVLGASGKDSIQGFGGTIGINNSGLINTGSEADRISARGSTAAIANNGLIQTGTGEDVIDGLNGGFTGTGTTAMGQGRDLLIGFGTGQFFGDAGLDTLRLPEGTYSIDAAQGSIASGAITMQISSFERIGGFSSGLFPFATGTLSVNAEGVASFN